MLKKMHTLIRLVKNVGLISDCVFPVVENHFSENRDPLTHRIYRVASFIRQLANPDDFVDGGGALDFEKIA